MRIALSLASLLAIAAVLPVQAADYEPPVVTIDDPVEYQPVEIGSGWYLRGDIGYTIQTKGPGTYSYRTFDPVTASYGEANFTSARMRGDFTWGGGFGYRFSDWLRADATVDGFNARFEGTTASAQPCVTGNVAFAGTSCRSEDRSSVSVLSFMVNGYADLGTYVGFTPYLGAGVGYSYLNWSALANNTYCVGATCPVGLVGTTNHGALKDWRFTYAAMAGVSYDVSNNLKVDVGYKYRRISSGEMFGWDAFSRAAGATGTQGRDPGLSSHEIRLGLRYELW